MTQAPITEVTTDHDNSLVASKPLDNPYEEKKPSVLSNSLVEGMSKISEPD